MAASHIQVAPDSTGKNIDTSSLTSTEGGAPTVHRQAVVIGDPATYGNEASVGKSGGLAVRSALITPTAVNVAAGNNATVCGPMDVSEAGALTIIAKNQTAATAWAGAPVLVIEQSDDGVSWAPMAAVRADNGLAASTHTLPANAANVEYVFDAPCEAISWARVRITTGPTTNPMTVVIAAGGHPFSPLVTATLSNSGAGRTLMAGGTVAAGVAWAGTTGVDTLITLGGMYRAGTVIGSGASLAITPGKTFRVQSMTVMLKANAALASTAVFTIRSNAAGATVAGSPFVFGGLLLSVAAVSGQIVSQTVQFGDGVDIPGGASGTFGVVANVVWATTGPQIYVFLTGYEY